MLHTLPLADGILLTFKNQLIHISVGIYPKSHLISTSSIIVVPLYGIRGKSYVEILTWDKK